MFQIKNESFVDPIYRGDVINVDEFKPYGHTAKVLKIRGLYGKIAKNTYSHMDNVYPYGPLRPWPYNPLIFGTFAVWTCGLNSSTLITSPLIYDLTNSQNLSCVDRINQDTLLHLK